MAEPTNPLAPVIKTMSPASGMTASPAFILLVGCYGGGCEVTSPAACRHGTDLQRLALDHIISTRILYQGSNIMVGFNNGRQPRPHMHAQEGRFRYDLAASLAHGRSDCIHDIPSADGARSGSQGNVVDGAAASRLRRSGKGRQSRAGRV